MTDASIVDRYVAAVNAAQVEQVVALFAEDGVLVNPLGTFAGREEIADFYRDVVLAGAAVVSAGAVVADGSLVMAEVSATSPLDPAAGTAHALDVFRLDPTGHIASLEIYYR